MSAVRVGGNVSKAYVIHCPKCDITYEVISPMNLKFSKLMCHSCGEKSIVSKKLK